MKHSIKTQLSLAISLVVLLTVVIISFFSNFFINRKFREYIGEQQVEKTQEIVLNLSQPYSYSDGIWNTDYIHSIGMVALYDGYIIKVYEPDGGPVWDAEAHDMSLCTQVMAEISERMQEKSPQMNGEFTSQNYRLAQDGQDIGIVTISYYGPYFLSEGDFQFLETLNGILFGIGLCSLGLSFVIGRVIATRLSRPITKVIGVTADIARGRYDIRFEGESPIQELNDLIGAVNHLGDALNRQEKLRRQLTADVAHELRTPLTTVGTHLEAMLEGVWEPTEERLKSCHEEVERITRLVKDLENLSLVENERLELNIEPVSLREVAETARDNFAAHIERKGLDVKITGTDSVIQGDRERVLQILMNLLSNAVKYTPENGVVEVSVQETEESILLEVRDNGIGIPPEELPYIFERFYRADKSRNRKTGGAGIGLAIVKSLVQAHGGTVTAESELNSGSSFTVSFPRIREKDYPRG